MTKFAHISDVHLGGWKAQALQDLNFKSFQKAIDICINSKLNFILIAGDLFDSAYPTIHEGVAIYGYPGKKSGLEVQDLRKIKFNDAPGMFKILMLHTTIDKAKGTLPIDAIETEKLPYADYYALGHLHIDFKYKNFVYPGPIFPNNFQELEDLKHGSFYIVDTESINVLQKIELQIKEIIRLDIQIEDALKATELIISKLEEKN